MQSICLGLRNAVHGEGLRTLQPHSGSGALVELEKGIAVAASAMAQVGALVQRTGGPNRLTRCDEYIVERMPWEIGQANHEARCTVAVLHQQGPGRRGRKTGAPIGLLTFPGGGT